ncbi:uncharacterized protein VICG_01155 [Vittaforma corneae ATCC 50505]|uniref:DNA-directed RNA polymerase subunit beta n=1 Tax=Vittaforma corneae (strain ATCC 50505) TaxID=993615 RepID=L2GLN7_VITCO|nr:uncharacterized protein VICG_01155 [Vittaforma corneae ATCC 50505]ELA41803.1 hypothetical protein VICG_01155 [Vittaforma corneae ATCC 50505]
MKSEETGDMHINQFNALFDKEILLNTVVNTPPFEISGLRLSFDGLEIHKPFRIQKGKNSKDTRTVDRRLLPKDCREQNLTYGGSVFLKIKLEYRGNVIFNEYKDAGVFPVMLRSCMCNLNGSQNLYELGEDPKEPGGYFIIDGYDRMVRFHVAQKRNFIFAHQKKSKDSTYTDYSVSIRSVSEEQIGQKNEIKYCADGNMHFKIYVNKRVYLIPVTLLLRALANCTDEEIFVALGSDQRILAMLARMKDYPCYSQKECLDYLGARFKPILKIENYEECGRHFIDRVVLPHLSKFEDKYLLIIEAIKKLFRCYDGKIQPDDVDVPSNFELYTELQLIPICFREKLNEIKRSFMTKIMYFLRNRVSTTDSTTSFNVSEAAELTGELSDLQLEKIKKHFESLDFDIGLKMKRFLSTGNITTVCCSDLLQNSSFTVLAERINIWRFTSHFASVSRGTFFSNLKITSIRKLRPESWGFFCPINTPDGAPCGLLFHLSQSCFVSDKSYVFDDMILYDFGVVAPHRGYNTGVPVFYNGKLSGTTNDPSGLAKSLREYRAKSGLCFEVCYEYGKGIDESVCIFDSYSNLYRKVFNVRLKREEWIGLKEQVFLNIKLSKYVTKDAYSKYDREAENEDTFEFEYREIDNTNIFSSIAACIPFSDHNPSPRNMYQCQMTKQAMGVACFNQQFRTDGKNFFVSYLQSPMVRTGAYSTFEEFPIGINCIVAVLSYTAYDMEDAVVINKSSTERGLFGAFIYKNEKFELEKNAHIDFTPFKGARIETDDVLVRYVHPDLGTRTIKYHGAESGFVEAVRIFSRDVPCVTITLRIQRNPTIGDKFCSRHGQKGVCSMFWQEIDMPFTEYGLRPDIIINPHAFPSRMTIGMLLESICGKSAMALGKIQDASPFIKNVAFDESDPKSIGEELKKCGFNYYGNEPMYSGVTGTEFRTDIFIGPVYYQRLRHMVNDKYQVRTSGAVVATTHQPVGGRKNKGGIRFGEMEKDALIAHGVSFALQDRLMNCSDRTEFTYCSDCKTILFTGKDYCSCGSKSLMRVAMPYVFKYLCCELLSMNVKLVFDV